MPRKPKLAPKPKPMSGLTLADLPSDMLSLIPRWLLEIEVTHPSHLCYQRSVLEAAKESARDVMHFGRVCKATHATLKKKRSKEEDAFAPYARALRREARARVRATRFVQFSEQGYLLDSTLAPPKKTVLALDLFTKQLDREMQSAHTAKAFHNAMEYDITTEAAHDVPLRIKRFNARHRPVSCALRKQFADHTSDQRQRDQLHHGWDAQTNALRDRSSNWTSFDIPSPDGNVFISYSSFQHQEDGGAATATRECDSLTAYKRIVDTRTGFSSRGPQLAHWRAEGVSIGWCSRDTMKVSHCGDLVALQVTDSAGTADRVIVWDVADGTIAQIVDNADLRGAEGLEPGTMCARAMEWLYSDGHNGHDGHDGASPVALLIGWEKGNSVAEHSFWTMEAYEVRKHQDRPNRKPTAPFAPGDAWATVSTWNVCVGSRVYQGELLALSASCSGRVIATITEGYSSSRGPAVHIWESNPATRSDGEFARRSGGFTSPLEVHFSGLTVSPCGRRVVCSETRKDNTDTTIRVWELFEHPGPSAGNAWEYKLLDVRNTMKVGIHRADVSMQVLNQTTISKMSPCGRFVMMCNRASGYEICPHVGPHQRPFGGGVATLDLFTEDPNDAPAVVYASGPMYGQSPWKWDFAWVDCEIAVLEVRGAFSVMTPLLKR